MHTEHLQNVRPVRVISGWLVAIAVTALLAFALEATGLMRDDIDQATPWLSLLPLAAGFFAGGFFAGFRALEAPILHAVGIALTSLVAAWLLNLIVDLFAIAWSHTGTGYDTAIAIDLNMSGSAVTVMLVQLVAAVIGALLGYNMALRGKPGLGEHEPIDM